jgi:hypothetical protein
VLCTICMPLIVPWSFTIMTANIMGEFLHVILAIAIVVYLAGIMRSNTTKSNTN